MLMPYIRHAALRRRRLTLTIRPRHYRITARRKMPLTPTMMT